MCTCERVQPGDRQRATSVCVNRDILPQATEIIMVTRVTPKSAPRIDRRQESAEPKLAEAVLGDVVDWLHSRNLTTP